MTLISEAILKTCTAEYIAQAFCTSTIAFKLKELNLEPVVSQDLHTLKYLVEQTRDGDPHVNPFEFIGKQHYLLINKMMDKLFVDCEVEESLQKVGTRYQLMYFLLREAHNLQSKESQCVSAD